VFNVFLLQSWWQSSEDVWFAHRLAESTSGRVFFTAGKDIDRYGVWDYLKRRRKFLALGGSSHPTDLPHAFPHLLVIAAAA
jgi:hypothetical protein